jgi:type II secretory pathway predicted ATPase ExeA
MPDASPFAPTHSRQSFLETPGGAEALRRLDDALGAREPFLLVTGDPGTGKTALAYEAIARWGSRVTAAFLAYPALTGAELLEEIVRRFGAGPPDGASRPKLVACLEWALGECAARGQVAVVVVDDAHNLSPESLEELRLVVNAAQQVRRPLEVLLVGLPALEARLGTSGSRCARSSSRCRPTRSGATSSFGSPGSAATAGACSRARPASRSRRSRAACRARSTHSPPSRCASRASRASQW